MPFRFSLRTLAAVVALVACLIGALVNASFWTAGVATLLTAGALVWALLAVIECRGPSRSFWRAFLIGVAVYAVGFTSITKFGEGSVTTLGLDVVGQSMPGAKLAGPGGYPMTGPGGYPSEYNLEQALLFRSNFVRIGQCAFAILAGFLGGVAASWMRSRAESRK